MILAETDDVFLSHHRLTAGKEIHICTHFDALVYDVVHLLISQIHMISIFRRPAAGAFQIAGAGGIEKNRPGDIAVIFLFVFILSLISEQAAIENEVFKQTVPHARIDIRPQAYDELAPVVVLVHHCLANGFPLSLQGVLPVESVKPVQKFWKILLRVLVHIREYLFYCKCAYVFF